MYSVWTLSLNKKSIQRILVIHWYQEIGTSIEHFQTQLNKPRQYSNFTLYLPSKEIEVGLKTPSTSVHIITIKHEEAVGRRWTRNLNKLQHIMELPMNIAYKDCFTLWVYRYVHTVRLPMKELRRPNKRISEYTSSVQSAAHDRTQQNPKTSQI